MGCGDERGERERGDREGADGAGVAGDEGETRGVGGVVHTHSTYATSWAQTGTPIPIYGTTHADHLAEDVPCTEVMSADAVQGDYETETGKQILECYRDRNPLHTPMVLVAGHGPFAWGEDAEKAVYNAVVLEEIARMAFITRTIHPGAPRLPAIARTPQLPARRRGMRTEEPAAFDLVADRVGHQNRGPDAKRKGDGHF